MKLKHFALGMMSCGLLGCASSGGHSPLSWGESGGSLVIGKDDDGNAMMGAVPLESAIERFSMTDETGRNIAYIALADGETGGLVFIDGKLFGTVSRHDATAFYSCRGYVTATRGYWARHAAEWSRSLLEAATPVTRVTLKFSGESTPRSIRQIKQDQLESAMSLLNFSLSPVSILRKLKSARETMQEKGEYEKVMKAFKAVLPGDSEAHLADIAAPADVEYAEDGIVLSYPNYAYEFYVGDGAVRLIQEPSLFHASRTRAALFYAPGMKWAECSPQTWRRALPEALPVQEAAK